MKRTLFAALALSFAVCLGMPAAAEVYTAPNGVLSVELPSDDWQVLVDPSKWIVLSDGGNVITVEHYSNGEKLPDMKVADDYYVGIYQAVISTQNEVFIVTGSVVDPDKISEIAQAILSVKVLKYDTKMAIKKDNTANVNEFTVAPMDKVMYVSADGLNVRMGCSTDERIIGGLSRGAAVKVTGIVRRQGEDYGWYQISYDNWVGYVSANFLTDILPEEKRESEVVFSGSVKTVYEEDGTAVTIYESMDGDWYDKAGTVYVRISDDLFGVKDGNKRLSVYMPVSEEVPVETEAAPEYTDGVLTLYDENGETITVYEATDGYWYDRSATAYVRISDVEFGVKDGNKRLYVGDPADTSSDGAGIIVDDSLETHSLISRDNGANVIVSAGGGAFYDEFGTEYSWIDDGGMMDYFGNTYDVEW